MPDRLFTEARLAALYDALCAGRPDFPFYIGPVMAARSVLDVGCGTGELLRLARAGGHTGRLVGLDPAGAMLDVARARADIEWVRGDLSTVAWERAFDLIVMTGHAFQVLVEDEELRAALAAIRAALTDDGRFIFETRNPPARGWERWTAANVTEVPDAAGHMLRYWNEVQTPVEGEVVRFKSIYTSPGWNVPEVSWSTLRFLSAEALSAFLAGANLAIAEQFGDWDRGPLTETSPEIITIAKRG